MPWPGCRRPRQNTGTSTDDAPQRAPEHRRAAPLGSRCQEQPIAHVAAKIGIPRVCASKWATDRDAVATQVCKTDPRCPTTARIRHPDGASRRLGPGVASTSGPPNESTTHIGYVINRRTVSRHLTGWDSASASSSTQRGEQLQTREDHRPLDRPHGAPGLKKVGGTSTTPTIGRTVAQAASHPPHAFGAASPTSSPATASDSRPRAYRPSATVVSAGLPHRYGTGLDVRLVTVSPAPLADALKRLVTVSPETCIFS